MDASIGKTLRLIAKLSKYPRTRGVAFEQHPIGSGIVDASTPLEMIVKGRNLRVSRLPWVDKSWRESVAMDDVIVGINVENLLRAFQTHLGKARAREKKQRGHPKRMDKLSVVLHAADFFRAYSATKPSNDENNPFRFFVETFFEVATRTKPPNLEWQVRQALSNYEDPRDIRLRYGEQREKPKKDK